MIALFRDKSIVAFFALVICTVLIHFHIFYVPVTLSANSNTGIFNLLVQRYLIKLPPIVITIVFILLILLQSIRLSIVLNNSKMYAHQGFTAAFAYVFLSGLLPNAYLFGPAFLVNSFIILLFSIILKFYNNQNAKGLLFNAGFLASSIVICYYPSIVLLIVTLCGLAILRPFRMAEWFILLIGIIAPFYLLFATLYLNNFNFQQIVIEKVKFYISFHQKDAWYFVTFFTIVLLMVAAFINWYPNSNRLVIQIRKNWVVMLILLFTTLLTIPIYTKMGALPELITLVPMAAFLANFFVYPKKLFFVNVFVFLVAIIIVYNNYIICK
ncbi:MAG: hypothetical protein NTZ59_04945 [Bacteroidetes bacterium]|nr:hypothetical protein [Bacteroidota bacterium]